MDKNPKDRPSGQPRRESKEEEKSQGITGIKR
jgi:hypothetical protein